MQSPEGGAPEAELSYQQELQLWLQKYKRYPRRLKRRGVEGEVLVAFTLDAEGRLLNEKIVRSSGESALDEAAVALLRAAEPMPAIPRALGVDQYRVEVPIRYSVDQ